VRFFKYSTIGGGTFLFDLGLLFLFTDVLGFNYVLAAGVSFLIAVSCNYLLSRKFVFNETTRGLKEGYVYFIAIALSGLALVTGSMYVLVEFLGAHYLVARVLVAGVTGIWNYTINLLFNFKITETI
jgi:putative flippase GtrA